MVVTAKSHILDNFQSDASYLIRSVLDSQQVPDLSSSRNAVEFARCISWHNATIEAIFGLISSGLILPSSSDFTQGSQSVMYSWRSGNSSGQTPINIRGLQATVYNSIRLKPSGLKENDFFLSNTDVFMSKMETGALAEHINSDLRECIACFRSELYLACITMLGRSVEGAWMNLGTAIASKTTAQTTNDALSKSMSNANQSISKKMKTVLNAYTVKDEYKDLWENAKVYPRDLEDVFNWSDTVRDARNSIHWGANPVIPNNYEKISIYLMGAIPNFRAISKIIEAC